MDEKEATEVYDLLRRAAREGGMVLVQCTRREDSKRVACLGTLEQLEAGHKLNICAVLVEGVAMELFGPPFQVMGDTAEMSNLGVHGK